MSCQHTYSMMRFLPAMLVCAGLTACGLLEGGESDDALPGKLVFSAQTEAGPNQIFTMKPDGSGLTQLTHSDFEYGPGNDGAGFNGIMPSWSPDGEEIVFSSYYKATSIGPGLWVMNADGSNLRPVKEYDVEEEQVFYTLMGNNPRWSPDGTKIAFDLCVNCQISTNHAIFVFDVETEELTRLTEEPAGYSSMYPAWSPDGTRIAFVANRDYVDADTMRYRRDLYVMDADGSNQTRVTETGYARQPIWNPDGNTLTFRSTSSPSGLYKVDVKSGSISKIKEDLSERRRLHPHAWSSDSSQLLVTVRVLDYPRDNSLSLFNLRKSKLEKVYSKPSYDNANPTIMGADWFVRQRIKI